MEIAFYWINQILILIFCVLLSIWILLVMSGLQFCNFLAVLLSLKFLQIFIHFRMALRNTKCGGKDLQKKMIHGNLRRTSTGVSIFLQSFTGRKWRYLIHDVTSVIYWFNCLWSAILISRILNAVNLRSDLTITFLMLWFFLGKLLPPVGR